MADVSDLGPVDYSSIEVPKKYKCTQCGKHGVRLYREYQTFLENQELTCTDCGLERYKKSHNGEDYDFEGKDITFEIGWIVAAIPTENGTTYWGYTAVPKEGVDWWKNLPR